MKYTKVLIIFSIILGLLVFPQISDAKSYSQTKKGNYEGGENDIFGYFFNNRYYNSLSKGEKLQLATFTEIFIKKNLVKKLSRYSDIQKRQIISHIEVVIDKKIKIMKSVLEKAILEQVKIELHRELLVPNIEIITTTIQYKKIKGVDPNLLSLDIYTKDDGITNKPVLIWVHGGGWHSGDKRGGKIEEKRDFALKNNWIFISINYRLSPKTKLIQKNLDPNRVMYPDHNNDIADGIAWIYKNISTYNGDKNKLALIGHSAGAHLVSLTGIKDELLTDRKVPFSSLVGVASIDIDTYDIESYAEQDIPMIVNAFGKDSEKNKDASPLFHIDPKKVYPQFFVARRGTERRIEKIDEFINALKDAGVQVTGKDYSNYTHLEIGEAIGYDEILTPDLQIFFETVFSNK